MITCAIGKWGYASLDMIQGVAMKNSSFHFIYLFIFWAVFCIAMVRFWGMFVRV